MDVHSPADAPAPATLNPPLLRTLVVCDIADSTALVEKLGDQQAAQLVRKHDRLARALLEQHHGREIDKTDGFLLLFERPIHAVAFALDYQRGLKHLSAAEGVVVRARVGIHMGDVVVWENSPEDVARGAKPIEIEGLAKPMAARLAQLAQPRQILLTAAAASIAHRAHGELGDCAAHVRWRALGRYLFKGLPEAVEVHEVGEEGVAAFRAPRGSRTAKRLLPWWRRPAVLAAEAAMLAVAIAIPAWMSTRSEPALAFAARDWVVVGDLQNLTGNSTFDQSVETALRISLEQSRYVNVLPELKVQETLQRMERDPAKTVVDRSVGSEIALRDGARALVLPTLAEINGKLRVTAEVIDPNSQATVYLVSAEGMGASSVVPSLDKVGQELRGRLGETLASISKESQPLDKVVTANLDALRAYSLGIHAKATSNFKDALAFFEQALKIDPDFARARIDLASTLFDANMRDAALNQLRTAETLGDRLGSRDRLMVEAWLSSYTSAREAMQKWKLLADLYPDLFVASGRYGYFAWMYANDFQAAANAIARSASPRNPNRVNSDFMLGVLALGEEQYPRAIDYFAIAESEGWVRTEYVAAGYAAQRKFDEAEKALKRAKQSGIASDDIDASVMRISIAIDSGNWAVAGEQLNAAKRQAADIDAAQVSRFENIGLSLAPLLSTVLEKGPASKFAPHNVTNTRANALGHASILFQRLWHIYLNARNGKVKGADDILAHAREDAITGDYPVLGKMFAVAHAEVLRAKGHADEAVKVLKEEIDGKELYVTHVALMDAYADAGQSDSALSEARWLSNHRGRAYAEYNEAWATTPFNVAQSNLALLRQAELLLARGQKGPARAALADFLTAWPNAGDPPSVKERIRVATRMLENG
ncbi:family 3 adenylate cyclase [Mizugakiibacter sediminis]|uniref:Adenylate cyclase n=1 Tax=Mizugakiibacter sediminis TaxID=1475481 RepID=A0A0K8QJH8_9GAMM|nr:putative peptide modification system cyclase [Mizugakiibacter sediminis]GAP64851.1 family 3 adenylate cyclase [Mizugakiibacter sediminis]